MVDKSVGSRIPFIEQKSLEVFTRAVRALN